jgi:hypothetical protein
VQVLLQPLGGGGKGKGDKGWKEIYLLCIASVENILATSVIALEGKVVPVLN